MENSPKAYEEFTPSSYLSARNRKKTILTTSPDPLEIFESNDHVKFRGYVKPPALLSSQNSRLKAFPCDDSILNRQNPNGSKNAPANLSSEHLNSSQEPEYPEQEDCSSSKETSYVHEFYEDQTPTYCLDRERKSVEDAIERYTQARIYASFENFLQERKSCRSTSAEFPSSNPVDSQVVTPQMVALTRDQALFRESHGDELNMRRPRTAADRLAGPLDYSADADVCEELYDKLHAVPGEGYTCIPRVPPRDPWPPAVSPLPVTDGREGQSVSPSYIQLCSNNKFFGSRRESGDEDHALVKAAEDEEGEEDEDEDDGDDDEDDESTSEEDDDDEGNDNDGDEVDEDDDCGGDGRREKLDIVEC